MEIKPDRLAIFKKAIEKYAKVAWEGKNKPDWPWRMGGGEIYVQKKVLERAAPHLTEDAMKKGAKENILQAIKYHYNLLSAFEFMYAITFIKNATEDELRDKTLAFLFGGNKIAERLKAYLDWAKLTPIPGQNTKLGIQPIVGSYLLTISSPKEYAFCKPAAYNSAVNELLGSDAVKKAPIERIIHCSEFYKMVLDFLIREYGLQDGNLLDVHSMFHCFQSRDKDSDLTAWEMAKNDNTHRLPTPSEIDSPLYALLLDKQNVVIYGPPGTGKTREAWLLGRWWEQEFGEDTVTQLTFHPSYCYEDFIESFRPTADGSGFTLKDGVFKKICKRAKENPAIKHLVIIDEINRGDLARILGELITLIEKDKRRDSCKTVLPLSGEEFHVPANLYLLGTMNTADKSISLIDLAIRRRFLFYYMPPDPSVLDDGRDYLAEIEDVKLSALLIGINQRLVMNGIDRDRTLGHSYLLIPCDTEKPLEILRNRFRYEIIPLIEEYCYANRSLMKKILEDLVEHDGSVNIDDIDEDDKFMKTLAKLANV